MSDDLPVFVAAPGVRNGVYANTLDSWYTRWEITLDFSVEADPDDEGRRYAVVARVRLPPSGFFRAIREMNDVLFAYERRWGKVVVPGEAEEPPLYPPDDLDGGTGV